MRPEQHELVNHNKDLLVRFFKSVADEVGFVPLHWHRSIELIYVLKGSITFTIESQQVVVGANQLILIPSSHIHADTHTANTSYVIQIPLPFLQNMGFKPETWEVNFQRLQHFDGESFQHAFDDFYRIYQSKSRGYQFTFYALLLDILKQIYVAFVDDSLTSIENDDRLLAIVNYINRHFTEKLTVADLAQHFGYNPNYLSRKFKNETGQTIISYLYTLRVAQAYNDLQLSNQPVQEILHATGLDNNQTTYQYFKQLYGVTPMQVRRKH